jgi:hypothetical protein
MARLQIPALLKLSDDQLNAIMAAAMPLQPDQRPIFLEVCAREIAQLGEDRLGDGSLHRLIMSIQRGYFHPPLETEDEAERGGRRKGVSKYSRELA